MDPSKNVQKTMASFCWGEDVYGALNTEESRAKELVHSIACEEQRKIRDEVKAYVN